MSHLHFVFLQGMPSPFFTRIGRELEARGCTVTGINLCVGDWIFWRGKRTLNYRGKLSKWPHFLAEFFGRENVTDIVLLGEQRHYHKQAVEVAKSMGIRVTVTDFGYMRPDWITLERDGMSGNSLFPRDSSEIARLAALAPKANLARQYTDSSWKMAAGDLLYHLGNVFLWWLYPNYQRSDRRPHPLVYVPASAKRLLSAKLRHRRNCLQVKSIIESGARFFVFPLQLEHDFQIVAYSPFSRLAEAIRMVIESFAEHSDPDSRLVIKVHPWDPGLANWGAQVYQYARELGVMDRIDYLDGGDLDDLIRASTGMVTVNSTSGVRALQLRCPVKALGLAVYDIPDLAYQGSLHSFWTEAKRPDSEFVDAFINVMAATVQIRGVFFNEPGLSAGVSAAAERLYGRSVGKLSAANEAACGLINSESC